MINLIKTEKPEFEDLKNEVFTIHEEILMPLFDKILKDENSKYALNWELVRSAFYLLDCDDFDLHNEYIINFTFTFYNYETSSNENTVESDWLNEYFNYTELSKIFFTTVNDLLEEQEYNDGDFCYSLSSHYATNGTENFILVIQK